MRRTKQSHNLMMRRLRWVGGALALLLLFFILRRGSAFTASTPAPSVTALFEQQVLAEPSLLSECSDWEYQSLSPTRDVKLLTVQFFQPHNLSFVLIGPRADRASLWAPQNVRSTCTVRPKAHGMQAYSVYCALNTTEDRWRADSRGEMYVNLQVDDVMFRKIPVCKDNVVPRQSDVAVCAFVSGNDFPWLEQWLEYYTMMGIDTFYLYEAVDNSRLPSRLLTNIAANYGEKVQWKYFSYHPTVMTKATPERARSAAYNDCWMRHRHNTNWIGFFEVQDFVYSSRGVENITKVLTELGKANLVEMNVWPMQENSKEHISTDHVDERQQLSNRLMLDKYQYRRDFPAGTRSFVKSNVINFVGDAKLVETDNRLISPAKSALEVLSFTVERDGFDTQDPHRWKPFPKPAQQLADVLAERLKMDRR